MRGLVTAIVLLAATFAPAEVAPINLKSLVRRSSVIAIGTVTSVHKEGIRLARFTVERVIKGKIGDNLEFIAEPTWACDASGARAGERLLVFLQPVEAGTSIGSKAGKRYSLGRKFYQLSGAGRGRIELLGPKAAAYIEFRPKEWMARTEYSVGLMLPKDLPYHRNGKTVSLPASALIGRIQKPRLQNEGA